MSLFFELLQVALGRRELLSRVPSAYEWSDLFDEAERQAVVGMLLDGIERLPLDQMPPKPLLLKWIGVTRMIEAQNERMDRLSAEVLRMFEAAGFEGSILKGQGNALMYASPWRRQSGDIDIWIIPSSRRLQVKSSMKGQDWVRYFRENRHEILRFVEEVVPKQKVMVHHVELPMKDANVEVHFFPSYLMNPWSHRRLLRWFGEEMNEAFGHEKWTRDMERLVVPTSRFNVVFQLVHIYLHYLNQGVGLRQVIDYYYVLKDVIAQINSEDGENVLCKTSVILHQLHMERFAAALMWVLGEVVGLSREEMLCDADGVEGRRVLEEVMQMGNFGQYDKRISKRLVSGRRYYWEKIKRKARLLSLYPHEVLSDPVWRLKRRMTIIDL